MDVTGPIEGRRSEAETDETFVEHPTFLPVDGQVVVDGAVVSFWCARCTRWVRAYIGLEGAKLVHHRVCHPR